MRVCSKHVQIFPRRSDEMSNFQHRSLRRTLARWYTCKHRQKAWGEIGLQLAVVFTHACAALTFLKNRASDPVRRGRPPVWVSEGAGSSATAGSSEVVSSRALMVPEESHGWTGVGYIAQIMRRKAGLPKEKKHPWLKYSLLWSGTVRAAWEPEALIFRVLLGPIISLLAGDIRVKPWGTPGDGWSSPKRRRLALPATGEL